MIKHNHLAKFIKNIKLSINRLITKKLNKFHIDSFLKEKFNRFNNLKLPNLTKVKKNYKFNLSILVIFVLFLSYLSFPISYNETELRNKLNNQLSKKFNYSFNLPKDFNYSFLPSPHFIYKNSIISDGQNEISQIGELKIFITFKNLFSIKNFDIRSLVIEKSNFNLNNQTYNFFTKLLDTDLAVSEIMIKNSNIFYKDKDEDVLFINKILDMEYFYDDKNLQNKLISKNEIFNLTYSIVLRKDNLTKKEEELVKRIAKETLEKLKQEKLKGSMWRESAQVSAQIRIIIRDSLLYLPQQHYPDDEIDIKTLDVYQHIYSNYYGGGSSIYNRAVA